MVVVHLQKSLALVNPNPVRNSLYGRDQKFFGNNNRYTPGKMTDPIKRNVNEPDMENSHGRV